MYYNPESKEMLSKEALQNLLNASFPKETLLIDGWHLIDEKLLYPKLHKRQFAEPDGIVFEQDKWCRTYVVRTMPAPNEPELIDPEPVEENHLETADGLPEEQAQKIALLEKAVQDLAQMVSNLEDYRMLYEREREQNAKTEEEGK